MKFDSRIFISDIIAFTETQLLSVDSDTEILNNLFPFKLHHQDHNTDKYSSMALCTRNTVEIREYEYFSSLNALKLDLVDHKKCKPFSSTLSKTKLQHLTIYRLFEIHTQ